MPSWNALSRRMPNPMITRVAEITTTEEEPKTDKVVAVVVARTMANKINWKRHTPGSILKELVKMNSISKSAGSNSTRTTSLVVALVVTAEMDVVMIEEVMTSTKNRMSSLLNKKT